MAPSGSRSVKRGCQRVLYWIPVVFIVLIVAWSYYAYVLELCIESIDDIGEKIIYLLAYHVTFIMFVWAYWQTIFTSPMNPLKEFHLSYSDKELLERADRGESQQEILRRLAKDLPIYTRTNSGGTGGALGDPLSCWGQIRPTAFKETKQCWLRTFTYKLVVGEQTGPQSASLLPMVACWVLSVVVWRGIYRRLFTAIRFCDRCQLLKPDRCHHCSVCDKCILKMDHHCPWVNNCVGFSNYKYFMLFLAYSLLYCLFITATDLQYFIRFWTNGLPDTQGKFHIMFLFFASSMFSVSLASLFAYHCWLVCKNRSTLEAVRGPAFRHGTDKNGFGLGSSKNFRQVFGDERRYWLLPVFSSLGDGCSFPTCLVNQDAEQPCSPEGHNANKIATEIQFPAKPLRESQSRLLSSTPSWIESDSAEDRERNGTSNPIMIIEHEA